MAGVRSWKGTENEMEKGKESGSGMGKSVRMSVIGVVVVLEGEERRS